MQKSIVTSTLIRQNLLMSWLGIATNYVAYLRSNLGSNQGPHRCEKSVLPHKWLYTELSYGSFLIISYQNGNHIDLISYSQNNSQNMLLWYNKIISIRIFWNGHKRIFSEPFLTNDTIYWWKTKIVMQPVILCIKFCWRVLKS